jgi:hypothetical protein
LNIQQSSKLVGKIFWEFSDLPSLLQNICLNLNIS